jgi:hypothetical protein
MDNLTISNRVPISRLPNNHIPHKSSRVARACDKCRSRKAKCDGAKPICSQCAGAELSCIYSESKRNQDRKELKWAKQKVNRYEKLLRELGHQVEPPMAKEIERALVLPRNLKHIIAFTLTLSYSLLRHRGQHLGKMRAVPLMRPARLPLAPWTTSMLLTRT